MGFGSEGFVEVNGGGVPIEDGPFEADAAAFDGEFGEGLEEGFAVAMAAVGGEDEEVFEVDAGAGAEGGVVVEEEREADGLAFGFRDERFGVGTGAEERLG